MARNYVRAWTVVLLAVFVIGLLVPSAPGQKDKDGTVFEVYKDKKGEYRYRLTKGDEKLAMAPHGFKTKEDVMKAIDTIKKEAGSAKVVEEKPAK